MKAMARGIASALGACLLLSVACGGRSVDAHRADGTTTESCRLFASRFQSSAQMEVSECAFDRVSRSLRCILPDRVVTTTWATIDDAVGDNRPVGRFTFAGRSFDFGGERFTESVSYDASGRPEFMVATAESDDPDPNTSVGYESANYLDWDANGRPTQAVLIPVSSRPLRDEFLCVGQLQSYDYDDANHRLVMVRSGGEGLNCASYTTTLNHDHDGLLVSEAYDFGGPPPEQVVEYTTVETGEICSD